ncbi:MAG TPA: MFS transporter [Polyangiaceae bacterium]|nr:MFS transporter [Polyangiaceae bacterium]
MNGQAHRARRTATILALSFVESFSGVLLQRGLYFYTHDVLAMSDRENLALALASGVTYAGGALLSHPLATRHGERRALLAVLTLLFALHTSLAVFPTTWMIALVFPLLGAVQGAKWPLVETFVSAGHAPAALARVLGRFNATWCLAIPLAMLASGALISSEFRPALFAAAGALNVGSLLLARALPGAPEHLAVAHPERPDPIQLKRFSSLLAAARFGMLLSYALLFLLAPLLPEVFSRLGVAVAWGASLSGLIDLARLVTFSVLGRYRAWRGRTGLLLGMLFLAPAALVLILTTDRLLWLIVGELCFGVAAATLYTAALYYAQLVQNASVEAGGAHESWIGVGFALGPASGLVGSFLQSSSLPSNRATLVALLPLVISFVVLSARHLLAVGWSTARETRPTQTSP